ncbi:hypothetical protein AB7M35_000712 [Amorphus suaedae]
MRDPSDAAVPDLGSLLASLRRDGVVVLPALHGGAVEALLDEHRRATSGALAAIKPPHEMDGERIFAATTADLATAGLRHLVGALAPDWFADLAAAYFGQPAPQRVEFVSLAVDSPKRDVDGAGNHHAHWDPTLCLRLMLYVSDVDVESGALAVKRGTHHDNHRIRLAEWRDGLEYSERPVCAGADLPFEDIDGPAGTVLVFDTSITHRRGLLAEGRSRRVAFGHAHSDLAWQQLEGIPYAAVDVAALWPHVREGDRP